MTRRNVRLGRIDTDGQATSIRQLGGTRRQEKLLKNHETLRSSRKRRRHVKLLPQSHERNQVIRILK